ncbi:filament-forming protein [Histoplasma capsulatum H143]|uniref:Filament-forming protein n=1 Tax=Ajellomyces capsulatus (strain H143) TaxID=544712 RepID=C6H6K6_AJECH|nr:filament-forming protein [Histoplasma capsulatum H143]
MTVFAEAAPATAHTPICFDPASSPSDSYGYGAVDIPFLSSHYSIPETSLNTLSQNPTVELVNQLLESISTKAREAEELKSDKLRLDVELENAVRSGESKVKVLKNSVEKGLAEIASLRGKLQESDNSRSSLESELASLRSSTSASETEFSSLKSRIDSLESSNRDTLALLESKSNAYDKLADDLSTQHKKTIELRREVATLEQKLQAANSASSSARFREQSLQQELELLKKNNEWFENELKTKSGEYLKFRKEKSARISELQRLNEDANSNIDALRRSENNLKSRLDEVEQKYEDSLATIQQLKEEAIQATESFRIELDSSSRLAQLQQTAAETAKRRVKECQLALEKMRDDAAEEISRLRAEIETEHSDKEAAERRVAELELNVRELQSEISATRHQPMSPGLGVNGAGLSTPLRPGTPVGAFSPRTSRTKGSLTLTQMYSEYDKMRTLLAAEQRNNQELKATMDEMVQDLESSKPEIDELRADHSRLEAAVVEMSNILDTAGKERDDATREARKWQGQVEGLEREGQILRQQLRDLSCQVKVLVMEVHLLGSGEKGYDRAELEKIAQGEMDDSSQDLNETGRFITLHLTTFKNVNELQQQNVTLRRMLRDLGDKMEGEEARRKSESYQKDQEELKELRVRVQTYRDEMANLIAQTKSYIKERDTFRSMLTRRRETGESTNPFSQSLPLGTAAPIATGDTVAQSQEGPDYTELLRKLQANFDSFRQETATDHSSLKQQVNDLTRKNSELQSEISRSNSQLAAAVQRAELLQSNFNLLKGENVELQKRHAILMENANKQDLRTQQVAEDLVEARGLVDSQRRETENLKAEKELWKKIEKRLMEDNESLLNERARLDSLNANLQSMLNEREHLESESRRRLQSTVESLESELQTTKRKLNEEMEEAKKSTLRREYENSQNQKRIDDLVTSLSAVREDLINTKSTRDHLQSRVDELSVELKSAEERLEVLQRKPIVATTAAPPAPPDTEPNAAVDEGGLSREQELAFEVSELKRDLELAKSELEHAKEQVEDYKAISQSTEERLQNVATYRRGKSEHSQNNPEHGQSDYWLPWGYPRTMHISSNVWSVRPRRNPYGYGSRTTRMQDRGYGGVKCERFTPPVTNPESNKSEVSRRSKTKSFGKGSPSLKVEGATVGSSSAGWAFAPEPLFVLAILGRYEREITELNRRREEVANQNTLLHQQLENITRQISTLQRDKESMPEEADEAGSSSSSLEGLQEVIKFLRREKEIVDVQYHLSTQEAKRLRQQLDYAQSQLDDTRLKLEQQRRAEADSEHNMLNHKKLMDTLNELNLFRESSVTLRNQAKQAEAALAEKSADVEELTQRIGPLETRIRELENIVETKDGEFKLLQEDRDRWQQRTQNILQKYDRVDPVEMEALKEKLAALEKERNEAVSARDEHQAQVTTLSTQVKQGEERIQTMRSTLTDQFKARSKELSSRIQAKQVELNTAIQEKEVIQLELDRTKEELNALKVKLPADDGVPAPVPAPVAVSQNVTDAQQPPAAQPIMPPTNDSASVEKIKALEEKIQRLEAALAEKEATIDQKVKERVDKMKETLNNKLAEYKTLHKEEVEKLKASHQQELESAVSSAAKPDGVPDLTDAQARELVAKNETIRAIVRNNIKNAVTKERAAMANKEVQIAATPDADAIKELEKKFSEERDAIIKERDQKIGSAVELAEKKLLAKLSMTEGRARNAQAKLEVLQKAAVETPQRPVVEVWEIAKVTRPAPVAVAVQPPPAAQIQPQQIQSPALKPTRTESPAHPPSPTPKTPTAHSQTRMQPQLAQPQPSPSPAPAQRAPTVGSPKPTQVAPAQASQQQQQPAQQHQPVQQQQPAQQQQPEQQQQQHSQPGTSNQQSPAQQLNQSQATSSLPNRPPQSNHHPAIGTGPGVLRALQSGLPIARGGRGRGGPSSQPHNPFGPQATEQQGQGQPPQQQQAIGRGSGLLRGGARGRGGQGRGGAQNVQTNNLPQGQSQPSPRGGRGALNAHARQFIPQGNKRARDDGGEGSDSGSGKRIRGGGAGS